MSKTSLYLPAPAFGLTWYESKKSESAFVLMPGGGGSSKTGVKNQIMISSLNSSREQSNQVQLLDGFLTDTSERSIFCSAISSGTLFVRLYYVNYQLWHLLRSSARVSV